MRVVFRVETAPSFPLRPVEVRDVEPVLLSSDFEAAPLPDRDEESLPEREEDLEAEPVLLDRDEDREAEPVLLDRDDELAPESLPVRELDREVEPLDVPLEDEPVEPRVDDLVEVRVASRPLVEDLVVVRVVVLPADEPVRPVVREPVVFVRASDLVTVRVEPVLLEPLVTVRDALPPFEVVDRPSVLDPLESRS